MSWLKSLHGKSKKNSTLQREDKRPATEPHQTSISGQADRCHRCCCTTVHPRGASDTAADQSSAGSKHKTSSGQAKSSSRHCEVSERWPMQCRRGYGTLFSPTSIYSDQASDKVHRGTTWSCLSHDTSETDDDDGGGDDGGGDALFEEVFSDSAREGFRGQLKRWESYNVEEYVHMPMYVKMLPPMYVPIENSKAFKKMQTKLKFLNLQHSGEPKENCSQKVERYLQSVNDARQSGELLPPMDFMST